MSCARRQTGQRTGQKPSIEASCAVTIVRLSHARGTFRLKGHERTEPNLSWSRIVGSSSGSHPGWRGRHTQVLI
jgi:hypothetical protein